MMLAAVYKNSKGEIVKAWLSRTSGDNPLKREALVARFALDCARGLDEEDSICVVEAGIQPDLGSSLDSGLDY